MNLIGKGECPKRVVRTYDHPEANGKFASIGSEVFTQIFTLEDGSILVVEMGRKGFECVTQLFMDMLTKAPPYDDGSIPK